VFSKLKETLHVKKMTITRYEFLDDATRSGGSLAAAGTLLESLAAQPAGYAETGPPRS
jgi:adenine/guanine phosphoribosyltransferase-like PRPP-binding protein